MTAPLVEDKTVVSLHSNKLLYHTSKLRNISWINNWFCDKDNMFCDENILHYIS